jgi:hypothetical protein
MNLDAALRKHHLRLRQEGVSIILYLQSLFSTQTISALVYQGELCMFGMSPVKLNVH